MDNSLLKLKIQNLKSIDNLEIEIPLQQGVFILCGENGLGKSTLFSVLSKIVDRGAFVNHFSNDGNHETYISFEYGEKKNEWTKQINWCRLNQNSDEILLNGFYERSFIFGSRFRDANKELLSNNIRKINKIRKDLVDADAFVYENLGIILKNNKNYYRNLKRIKHISIARQYGFKNTAYFWETKNELVFQICMSSGEYLLINLLHFINQAIQKINKRNDGQLRLIFLDEIEMALHPSAQKRLTDFLQENAKKYNLCIYCATHSTQMVNKINPKNIFYLENLPNNQIKMINPCYPAYLTRDIYTNDGFDYLILVEDRLAKLIVEKIYREISSDKKHKLIHIIPCGGWEKTLELQYDFKINQIGGQDCKIVSILDADIKNTYKEKSKTTNPEWANLPKNFLPIESLEKFLRKNLFDDINKVLYDNIGCLYNTKSLSDILIDYRDNYKTEDDKNGKKLFSLLQSCAEDCNIDINTFNIIVCDIVMKNIDYSKFEQSIKNLLDL